MVSLVDQCGKGQGLSCAPVNAFARFYSRVACLEDLYNLRVEISSWRQYRYLVSDITKDVEIDASVFHITVSLWVLDLLPMDIYPVFALKL